MFQLGDFVFLGGLSEEEVAARVAEAVEAVQAEHEDGLGDLLVCLGQEEQKVER